MNYLFILCTSDENKDDLDTKEEIGNAIDNLKSGKRAGSDGLLINLYKTS